GNGIHNLHHHHDQEDYIEDLDGPLLDPSGPKTDGFTEVIHARIKEQYRNEHQRDPDKYQHDAFRSSQDLCCAQRPRQHSHMPCRRVIRHGKGLYSVGGFFLTLSAAFAGRKPNRKSNSEGTHWLYRFLPPDNFPSSP